ncbi:hypothetical protein CYMTET_27010 [Cymbomonas tetramitiformis]|nr:hypothetical protein CYMTET_27010 [Cymbomonas tetramitiformis]
MNKAVPYRGRIFNLLFIPKFLGPPYETVSTRHATAFPKREVAAISIGADRASERHATRGTSYLGYACAALALTPTVSLCSSDDSASEKSSHGKDEAAADWDQLRELKSLKDDGILDSPEYKKYRTRLLENLTAKPASNEPARPSKRKSKVSMDSDNESDGSDDLRPPPTRLSKATKAVVSSNGLWENLATAESRDDAVAFKDALEYTFKYIYGGPRSGGVYKCTSHVDCPCFVRTCGPTSGQPEWLIQVKGEHADVEIALEDRVGKHSIAKELLHEVDTLLGGGMAPKLVYNKLRLKYKKKKDKFKLIPSIQQIQNRKRKHTRERLGSIKFETPADLTEFTNAHLLPSTKSDALALDTDQLVVLPGGVFALDDGMGFVFSSISLLGNVVTAKKAWGSKIPSETDGTYKIVYNGWPCLVYGTHSVEYDTARHSIRQSFRPWTFMMAKSESTLAYATMFRSFNAAVKLLFDIDFMPANGNSDRATEIRKAYEDVYGCNWTTCWPHIARKPFVEFRSYMEDKSDDFQRLVHDYLLLLHMCRNQFLFDALAQLVVRGLEHRDEKKLAKYILKEYLSAPHNRWYYGASGIPGVEPSSQPIESYNKDTKQNKILNLRCQMDELLTKGLPELLWLDGQDHTGAIHRRVPADLMPSELLEKAACFSNADILEYPASSGVYYLNRKAKMGCAVTSERVIDYVGGLNGTAKIDKRLSTDRFCEKYLSLHKVWFDPEFELEEGEQPGLWVCDCKGFFHSVVCSHVLKVKSLTDGLRLEAATEMLPKRKRSGRHKPPTPALTLQPESPPAQKKARSARRR